MVSLQTVNRQSSSITCELCSKVQTADADATQLDSCVASASAVCIGLKTIQAIAGIDFHDKLDLLKSNSEYSVYMRDIPGELIDVFSELQWDAPAN